MSKAAELAKIGEVATNSQIGGRRNIVINGAMQVAQRSTEVAALGANGTVYATVDRFAVSSGGPSAGRFTMSQTADGPSGFRNCLKLDCTTVDTSIAAAEVLLIEQRIEGQDLQQIKKGTSDAEKVTISFYAKSNAERDIVLEIFEDENNRHVAKLFTIGTSWARHSYTFPADTTGDLDDDNGIGFYLSWWLHAGATYAGGTLPAVWANNSNANRAAGTESFFASDANNFFITGVQMEVGSVATPFEHRSFGEELALCQRYYQKITTAAASMGLSSASSYNTAQVNGVIQIVPSMRATPSIDIVTVTNGYRYVAAASNTNFDVLSLEAGSNTSQVLWVKGGLSGLTAGQAGWLQTTSTSSYMAFKSEL